jgi:Inner membrane protein YgaP-like, transmembrane domain
METANQGEPQVKLQINEHPIDRVARVVIGVVLFALIAAGAVAAPWLYLAGFVGALLLVTGIVGFCPLYAVLRLSTLTARR